MKNKIVSKFGERFNVKYLTSFEIDSIYNISNLSKYSGLMLGFYNLLDNPNILGVICGGGLYVLGNILRDSADDISNAKRFTIIEDELEERLRKTKGEN